MSPSRLMTSAAVIALTLSTPLSAQNRMHRRAVYANRPINPYTTMAAYRGTPTSGDIQTLTQAYSTLATADHDYHGHRAKAMHAIKKAAKMMGQKLGGDGKGKEQQTLSDSQLKGVQGMLQKVKGSVSGGKQQRVVQHLNEAIHELTVALSVK
jgi:hypothetical protein